MNLATNEEYQIIKAKNPAYQGYFCYGNFNTKIFCLVTCNSKKPLQKNCIIFQNITEAFANNYRPCKGCTHIPTTKYQYTTNWIIELEQYLNENYYYDLSLDFLADNIGINKYHLVHRFKAVYQTTPINYLIEKRLVAALTLIKNGLSISDAAFRVGFKSYHYFARCFKKHYQYSPGEIKK
ncbi:Ada metal-binding domain-containing protein [Spiroplasma chrysopicola]|uniref:AraC family transcriptional regulator n=1 Tax=Spiroplasma chrysopicola DF-1 TaxID=1276227 RepID=R4UCG4_9MOLU|nr:Ada metal-binding domain-containing protein [Spiroplasma chrysopicola]AGM25584.1 AraC family transcriptional regulator [Spiroplasma chrysopicola DF-1]